MKKWKRNLLRLGVSLFGALALIAVFFIVMGWTAFGARATGERRARMERSKQWAGSHFENPQPLWNDAFGMLKSSLEVSPVAGPGAAADIPTVRGDETRFKTPPASGLRITWFGHSTRSSRSTA